MTIDEMVSLYGWADCQETRRLVSEYNRKEAASTERVALLIDLIKKEMSAESDARKHVKNDMIGKQKERRK